MTCQWYAVKTVFFAGSRQSHRPQISGDALWLCYVFPPPLYIMSMLWLATSMSCEDAIVYISQSSIASFGRPFAKRYAALNVCNLQKKVLLIKSFLLKLMSVRLKSIWVTKSPSGRSSHTSHLGLGFFTDESPLLTALLVQLTPKQRISMGSKCAYTRKIQQNLNILFPSKVTLFWKWWKGGWNCNATPLISSMFLWSVWILM